MKFFSAFFAILLLPFFGDSAVRAQSIDLLGRWKVEFTLSDTEKHTLDFEAQASGKGTFLLLDARSNLLPPVEPVKASWERVDPNVVTFSGEIEFPIGNVGRNPGILVFKGSFESQASISGRVAFFVRGQNPNDPGAVPIMTGKFTAKRMVATGGRKAE